MVTRTRRQILATMLAGAAAAATDSAFGKGARVFTGEGNRGVFRIAFGSCLSQRKPQTFWSHILARQPDVFVMMGDGIYPEQERADLPVLEQIESAYRHAATRTELREFRRQVPVIAIWDDNDYGGGDVGSSLAFKARSRELFLDFWASPAEKKIRDHDSGIYGLWEFGQETDRTQIIVPDLRYCRSEWAHSEARYLEALRASGFGPYVTEDSDAVTMLGERQWLWLERCLRRPAQARFLISSIQCLPEGRGWESWSNFPAEKARLLKLIRDTGAQGLMILSGDTHYAEISRVDGSVIGYPLWEVTSSGLTEIWPTPGPNPFRQGSAYPETNFGLVTINRVSTRPVIVFEIYSAAGIRLCQQSILLDSLTVAAKV